MNTTTNNETAKLTQTVLRHKLALNPDAENPGQFLPVTLMITPGFRVTAMQMTKEIKPGTGAIEIYTLCQSGDMEPRTFKIARTGEEMPHAGNAIFHFTMAFPGMPALHLFELL